MNTKSSEQTQQLLLSAVYSSVASDLELSGDLEQVVHQFAQAKDEDRTLKERQVNFVDALNMFLEITQSPFTPTVLAWALSKLPTTSQQAPSEQIDSIERILKVARLQLVEAGKISRHDVRFLEFNPKSAVVPRLRSKMENSNLDAAVNSFAAELAFSLVDRLNFSLQSLEDLDLTGTDTIKLVQLLMTKPLHQQQYVVDLVTFNQTQIMVQRLLQHLVGKAFDSVSLEKECMELQHQVQAVNVIVSQRKQLKIEALSNQLKSMHRTPLASNVIVCLDPFPPATDRFDQDVLKRYERLRSPIALQPLPTLADLQQLEATMKLEFPWATLTVDAIAEELRTRVLAGGRDLYLTPKVLFGAAGSGKNRFARRLAELLHQPFSTMAMGGHGDVKSISGTARGWATGQPSPILELMVTRNSANPMIVLDEIDKINSRLFANSPPIASILLQFLERENAGRYRDLFLQAPCDLSHVIYIATSNSLETLPLTLLSRMQVLPMPSPEPEHFAQIFHNVLRDEAVQLGLPESYFEHFEMDKSGNLDACKNIRDIQRLVKGMCNAWIHATRCKEKLH